MTGMIAQPSPFGGKAAFGNPFMVSYFKSLINEQIFFPALKKMANNTALMLMDEF